MKINKWTLGLAAVGAISLGSVAQAEEAKEAVKTALSSTVLSGYVSGSVWYNPGSGVARNAGIPFSSAGANGFGPVQSKANNLNLDVVDIKLEKALGEGEWAAGYAAELWFGPDANGMEGLKGLGTTSTGWSVTDLAIKQAYVNLRIPVGNGIETKIGVFDTPIGYETPNSGSNPNYTRSYGWAIEPTQHTGILASYRFCDWMNATAGIANSHSPQINSNAGAAESQKTFIGAITLTAPKSAGALQGATLTAGVVDGRSTSTIVGVKNPGPDLTSIYVGASIPLPVTGLRLGLSYDLAHKAGKGDDSAAYALYLSYQATKKLTLSLREDWATHVAGVTGAGVSASTGSDVLGSTLTADYALWANVITRLEYRWDHDISGTKKDAPAFPLNKNGTRNAQLLALNVIYKF